MPPRSIAEVNVGDAKSDKRGLFAAAEDGTPSIAGEVIRACLPVLWRDPRADGSGRSAPHDGRHGAMPSRRFALTDHRDRSINGEILLPDAAISGGRFAGGSARRPERRGSPWHMPKARRRTTHDGYASFEAPLRGAPQDEEVGMSGHTPRNNTCCLFFYRCLLLI